MSEIAKHFEKFFIENWERIFWIMIGGWIQIHLAEKKGVKFSKKTIITTFIIAGFIGYWTGELCDYYNLGKFSNFISSMSAVGSHSVLNFWSENIVTIIKAVVRGKFKIDLDNKKENEESN